MPEVVMVIAPQVFRDEEYAEPREVLESRGAHVTVASVTPGQCIGKLGLEAQADISLSEALARPWDAVVFVGGAGATVFFDDVQAHRLAREALERDATVAAICIAPSILARAGLLQGVEATAFASQEDDLREHGASWTGAPVAVAGRLITANGPAAATAFGEAIASSLGI